MVSVPSALFKKQQLILQKKRESGRSALIKSSGITRDKINKAVKVFLDNGGEIRPFNQKDRSDYVPPFFPRDSIEYKEFGI